MCIKLYYTIHNYNKYSLTGCGSIFVSLVYQIIGNKITAGVIF